VKNFARVVGVLIFIALYVGVVIPFPATKTQVNLSNQSAFQKKQAQISISSQQGVFIASDVLSDNGQNYHPSGVKKYNDSFLSLERAIFYQEKSKFKQYSATWQNLLIASRKTDQLFPHHTFG
jgi:hypothetical protein